MIGVTGQKTDPFVTSWNTENAGSATKTIVLPLSSAGTYNFWVHWGDGTYNNITAWNDAAYNADRSIVHVGKMVPGNMVTTGQPILEVFKQANERHKFDARMTELGLSKNPAVLALFEEPEDPREIDDGILVKGQL